MIENSRAWHNVPIGTKANGLDGLDTVLDFNTPLEVKLLQTRRTAEGQELRLSGRTTRARAASPRANARSS